jgi:transcription antitermination protein NusB
MLRRSKAREVALQALFERDQNPKPMSPAALARFVEDRLGGDTIAVAFCMTLLDGVSAHQTVIDAALAATAENWKLHRMLPADRNVLRMGVFEMKHAAEPVPPAAAINEAVELARRFGSIDSPGFINGILDRIHKAPAPAAANA